MYFLAPHLFYITQNQCYVCLIDPDNPASASFITPPHLFQQLVLPSAQRILKIFYELYNVWICVQCFQFEVVSTSPQTVGKSAFSQNRIKRRLKDFKNSLQKLTIQKKIVLQTTQKKDEHICNSNSKVHISMISIN